MDLTLNNKNPSQILADTQKEYHDNFAKLLASVDTPEHRSYLKTEKKLFRKEVKLRKELGVLAKDPCPLVSHRVKVCDCCSGYIKKIFYKKIKFGWRKMPKRKRTIHIASEMIEAIKGRRGVTVCVHNMGRR